MKPKREKYLKNLLYAFILNNLIFLSIIMISFSVSQYNYKSISNENNIILQYIEDVESLSETFNCNSDILIEASDKLDKVGVKLNILETRFGKKDARVLQQKKLYSELEVKHFNIIKKLKETCEEDFITILFFYTNLKPNDKKSQNVGFILTTFKNKAPEKIMVYALDYNLDSSAIDSLKETYHINEAPSTLINEQITLDVKNIEDLENILTE